MQGASLKRKLYVPMMDNGDSTFVNLDSIGFSGKNISTDYRWYNFLA